MLGYQAHREVAIWLETREATEVTVTYQPVDGGPLRVATKANPAASPAGVQPMTFVLPLLEMGTRYRYQIEIDGERMEFPYALEFETTEQWEWRRNDQPPAYSFFLGSCSYLNDPPYDRPGTPYGKGTEIFQHMARRGADFMLWAGDNFYLREADFSSRSGIWYRYSKDRSTPDLQPLLAAMHHYAIWDDHDYGSNDANRSFAFKDETTKAFTTYFANPGWGEPGKEGIYGQFYWGDAVFLLLDNRTHRDDAKLDPALHQAKTQYGEDQLQWLEQALLHAADHRNYDRDPLYPFRFIVTGSQFLATSGASSDSHHHYPGDRERILEFIRQNQLRGVVFLTGDVHHSGLYRMDLGDGQYVYELTSSPLSSGSWDAAASPKANDPALIPGTLVGTQNYCRIVVSGPAMDRRLLIQCFDKADQLQWEREIRQSELGW